MMEFAFPHPHMLNTADIVIPEVTDEMQKKYGGGRAAIVDGKFIDCAMDSEKLVEECKKLGFGLEEIVITFIPRYGAVYF